MSLLRDSINQLPSYRSARDEFKGIAKIALDANENPFRRRGGFNRYPDGRCVELVKVLSTENGVAEGNILIGSGSDECIDILLKAVCNPGDGEVVTFPPTYGMYEVAASVLGIKCRKFLREADFSISVDTFLAEGTVPDLIFLCSPNNPTGNSIEERDLRKILLGCTNSVVVVDEAYIDFSSRPSFSSLIGEFRNLVILRTLSKAVGLAGIRVGYLIADEPIIAACNQLKLPYNVSSLSERFARRVLRSRESILSQVFMICQQRELVAARLGQIPIVRRVFPSDGNFLLVECNDSDDCRKELEQSGIVVRDRSREPLCARCLRITIGTPDENEQLLATLVEISRRFEDLGETCLLQQ